MLGAFLSEWPKIRRRSILLAFVVMVGLTAVAVGVTLARIHRRSLAEQVAVNTDAGLTSILQPSAALVSVIVLITIAAVLGADWTQGTWRNLLVQEPRRVRLLCGRVLALLLYMIVSAVITVGVATVVAMIVGPQQGVHTVAWWDPTGTRDYLAFLGNLVLAVVGWTIFGTLVAVLVRNPAGAVGASIAWLFVIEGLASQVWSSVGQYLPGRILSVVLDGGQTSVLSRADSTGIAYTTALLIAGLYAVAMAAVACTSFWYRDVTA